MLIHLLLSMLLSYFTDGVERLWQWLYGSQSQNYLLSESLPNNVLTVVIIVCQFFDRK